MQRICQSNVDDIFSVAHDCDEATVWTVQKGGCKYFRRTDLFDGERNLFPSAVALSPRVWMLPERTTWLQV